MGPFHARTAVICSGLKKTSSSLAGDHCRGAELGSGSTSSSGLPAGTSSSEQRPGRSASNETGRRSGPARFADAARRERRRSGRRSCRQTGAARSPPAGGCGWSRQLCWKAHPRGPRCRIRSVKDWAQMTAKHGNEPLIDPSPVKGVRLPVARIVRGSTSPTWRDKRQIPGPGIFQRWGCTLLCEPSRRCR